MSVAPCVLLSAADFGDASEARLPAVSGSKIQKRPEPRSLHFQETFPEFAGPKYRTQKNARDATMRPARSKLAFTDYKSPE
jgi:hypothetical protein